jgi:hypothetical protein
VSAHARRRITGHSMLCPYGDDFGRRYELRDDLQNEPWAGSIRPLPAGDLSVSAINELGKVPWRAFL